MTNENGDEIGAAESNPQKALDGVVAEMIDSARKNADGFVLHLAKKVEEGGAPVQIEVQPRRAAPDEWRPPAHLRAHELLDAESLVTFANRYGTMDNSLILYDDDRVQFVINELVDRGERELVLLNWKYSPEWKAWTGLLTAPVDHRTLLTHLILQQHTLEQPDILARCRDVKATFTANIESDLRTEKETIGVVFKSQAGESLIKFPSAFDVILPCLDVDLEDATKWVRLPVRLEVQLPREPNQPVMFQLLSPTLNAVRRERLGDAMRFVQDELPGWTIVRGKHGGKPVSMPRLDAKPLQH